MSLKKNRYKVNFPPQVLAGSWIRISLPLKGFLGVFTSRTDRLWAPWISGTNIKGEAKPGRIGYHLFFLSGSGRALTSLVNGDYLDTQSQLTVALWLIHISFYLVWCRALVSEFFLCPSIPWRRLSCQNTGNLIKCATVLRKWPVLTQVWHIAQVWKPQRFEDLLGLRDINVDKNTDDAKKLVRSTKYLCG